MKMNLQYKYAQIDMEKQVVEWKFDWRKRVILRGPVIGCIRTLLWSSQLRKSSADYFKPT